MAKITRYQAPEKISIDIVRYTEVSWGDKEGIIIRADFNKGDDCVVHIDKMRCGGGLRLPSRHIPILQEMLQEFMEALESIDD